MPAQFAQAVVLVVIACAMLAAMDGLGKWLMADLHTMQVIWARYTFHTVLVGLYLFATHHHQFWRPAHPGMQIARGLSLLTVTFATYFAISVIPLADATAIMFFAPVLVTLLAGWVLKEKVRGADWLAALIGFAGVLLIAQPGFTGVEPMMLLPLISAAALAVYFLLTRMLRGTERDSVALFHTTFTGSIAMSALVPFFWLTPEFSDWGWLILIGALGAGGHLLLIRAFRLQEASILSPWLNAQIVAASLFSLWIFDDPLSIDFLSGAVLIIGAGILSWVSQQKRAAA